GPGSRHQSDAAAAWSQAMNHRFAPADRNDACKTARALIIWYFRHSFDSEVRRQGLPRVLAALTMGTAEMPSLLRLFTIVGLLCAVVYGGLYALAHFVQPKSREISVSIPPDKFFKEH